jgi:hypothetical protein
MFLFLYLITVNDLYNLTHEGHLYDLDFHTLQVLYWTRVLIKYFILPILNNLFYIYVLFPLL